MLTRRKFLTVAASLGIPAITLPSVASGSQTDNDCSVTDINESSGNPPDTSRSVLPQERYPRTIEICTRGYTDGIQAYHTFAAYEQKALAEKRPGVANLLSAFSACEFVTARNFNNILLDLGVKHHVTLQRLEVQDTTSNLKAAVSLELNDIESRYPELIEKLLDERHVNAQVVSNRALKARMQHHKMLRKLKDSGNFFLKMIISEIENRRYRFFVCDICGSVNTKVPKKMCPVCENPDYFYRELPDVS